MDSPGSSSSHIETTLSLNCRLTLCELLSHLLRKHFGEPWNRSFCLQTLKDLCGHFDLPEMHDRGAEMNAMLDYDHEQSLDTIIELVERDAYLKQHGYPPLILSLIIDHVKRGVYDSRYRILVLQLSRVLRLHEDELEECERIAADILKSSQSVSSTNEHDGEAAKLRSRNKMLKRAMMIGAGGAVGGLLIGLTGGLATPILAMGLTALSGSTLIFGLTGTAAAAVVGSIFGVAGAGWTGYKVKRRVGAIEEFIIEPVTVDDRSLRVTLAVSGWITENFADSFRRPWICMNNTREQACLRYESKYLMEFGKAINYMLSVGVACAVQHFLMETSLAGVMSAIAWPISLLSAASVIDNPWNVCIRRAKEVGEELSNVLLSKKHGNRPVTLIGFSIGARVIFNCLLSMHSIGGYEGIVEDVILLGAPVGCCPDEWQCAMRVVAGRLVNGYCKSDWLLRFLYRTMNFQLEVCGLSPVLCNNIKLINVDLSSVVTGHNDYMTKLTECLALVGVKLKNSACLIPRIPLQSPGMSQ